MDPDDRRVLIKALPDQWGRGASVDLLAPSLARDERFRRWWARLERLGASPGAAMALRIMNGQIDIRSTLSAVRVPTLVLHRTGDLDTSIAEGRYLASHIPGARFIGLPGADHLPWAGDQDEILDHVEEFLTGARSATQFDRVLATVLFTDIVGSTKRASKLGDRRWRDLLQRHNAAVRHELDRFRGREIKTVGDGFLATFDGPARGIRCACAIRDAVGGLLGLSIRAGLHTGECELIGNDVGGIAVHIGARVAARAHSSEVLVSSTVKDLVAGSGIEFVERGTHRLKGVPGVWRLFTVQRAPSS
jgi:class 3 adenylate cyclase